MTAPEVRLARTVRWRIRTSTINGTVTIEAAIRTAKGSSNWELPANLAIATWTVRASKLTEKVEGVEELVPGHRRALVPVLFAEVGPGAHRAGVAEPTGYRPGCC